MIIKNWIKRKTIKNRKFFRTVTITFVSFLFVLPSVFLHSSINKDKTFPTIDLNKHNLYVRASFKKEWTSANFTDYKNADWKMIMANPAGNRSVKVPDINIPNFPKRHFLEWKEYPARDVTYLIPFRVDEKYLLSIKPLALFVSSIGHNWEIYINGHLIKKEVHLNKDKSIATYKYVRDLLVPFEKSVLTKGDNIIVFRIISDPTQIRSGFFRVAPYLIGDLEILKKKKSEVIDLILMSLYFFLGLYHLLLFLRRRKDTYNLFFALFAVLLFIYLFSRSNTVFDVFANYRTIAVIELVSLLQFVPIILMFLNLIWEGKISKISKYYYIYTTILALFILPSSVGIQEDILRLWQMTLPFYLGYIIFLTYRSLQKEYRIRAEKLVLPDKSNVIVYANPWYIRIPKIWKDILAFSVSGNFLVGLIIMIFCGVFDVLDSVFFNTGLALMKYGFFIFIIGIAVALANEFLTVHQQVEELNANLEEKVLEKTAELQSTLTNVQKLKTQQDGDYFLTTLLIKPLMVNLVESENVKVDFLLKQKKNFQFRKWNSEIGGDLCSAYSIRLKDRPYTVFINADAMGKSIQGAGGALVLGAVLRSIIERVKLSGHEQNIYPERWLKNTFVEFQNVFESFDGSMLMSMVVGLIDDKTGLMYFINSEHPWTVLYRERETSFIDSELVIHKVGVAGAADNLRIRTFLLKKGDVIICGSDGRDDVLLSTTEDGTRVINEDETIFLKHILNAGADLKSISKSIAEVGELTDDLSLLRVEYVQASNENYGSSAYNKELQKCSEYLKNNNYKKIISTLESVVNEEGVSDKILRLYIKALVQVKDYALAFNYSLKFNANFPEDLELLYVSSFLAKKIKNYNEAIDIGERYRLRRPSNVKNLTNLAESYYRANHPDRAKEILSKIFYLDPKNKIASKLQELLKEKAKS